MRLRWLKLLRKLVNVGWSNKKVRKGKHMGKNDEGR